MNRYIIPRIFCVVGALVIFAGLFLSGLNITLGSFFVSIGIAIGITILLLLFAILAFKMKTSNKKKIRKIIPCRFVEILSVLLFFIAGLASLLLFNHCFAVWQRSGEIQAKLNIRQLESMLPEYEQYANQRIANYNDQLSEAISYRSAGKHELMDLGFNTSSSETLESQKARKIEKLKQILRPHTYKALTDTIATSIAKFVSIVEGFSPITAPKNITRIEEWAKYYQDQLNSFSHYKMKGENAADFQFESTFGDVKEILTGWKDGHSSKRFVGYLIGITALIFMLFPYVWGSRSMKFR